MDVRCERCKTEYEFDDARITEAGVAVKCTTCGHVFKVKKKALVVTVPVKPDDVAAQNAIPAIPSPPVPASAQDKREWKVRQSNGNVFTFKELTTLQKWIVERKVARDDEISLTGETWKRLGNIAELASFFQVVEEAQKAAHLAALQAQGLLTPLQPPVQPIAAAQATPPAAPVAAPTPTVPSAPTSSSTQGSVAAAAPKPDSTDPRPAGPAPVTAGSPTAASVAPASSAGVVSADGSAGAGPSARAPGLASPPTLTPAATAAVTRPTGGGVGTGAGAPAAARSASGEPRFVTNGVRSAARVAPDDDLAAAGLKRSGGAGKVVLYAVLLAALGAGGYYAYQSYWVARLSKAATVMPPTVSLSGLDGPFGGEEVAPAEVDQAEGEDAGEQGAEDAGVLADAAADAGTEGAAAVTAPAEDNVDEQSSVVVPSSAVASGAKKAAGRGYDYWLAQGDRLRVRERFASALQAYAKAAELEPQRAEPRAGSGLVLLDQGRETQAEAAFREALQLNPRYAVAVMGLAETYKVMGKKAEAIQYYQRYLEILPNGPEAAVARAAIDRLKE